MRLVQWSVRKMRWWDWTWRFQIISVLLFFLLIIDRAVDLVIRHQICSTAIETSLSFPLVRLNDAFRFIANEKAKETKLFIDIHLSISLEEKCWSRDEYLHKVSSLMFDVHRCHFESMALEPSCAMNNCSIDHWFHRQRWSMDWRDLPLAPTE